MENQIIEEPKQKHLEWKYRDADCAWWTVAADAIDQKPEDREFDSADDYHWRWYYEFRREGVLIDSGELQGQYWVAPLLTDVLREFGNYMTSVLIGMAAYSSKE